MAKLSSEKRKNSLFMKKKSLVGLPPVDLTKFSYSASRDSVSSKIEGALIHPLLVTTNIVEVVKRDKWVKDRCGMR